MASKLSTNRGSWRVKHGKRLSKANPCKGLDLKSIWEHHLIHDPRSNYIHKVKKYFVSLSILWQWFKNYTGLRNELSPR